VASSSRVDDALRLRCRTAQLRRNDDDECDGLCPWRCRRYAALSRKARNFDRTQGEGVGRSLKEALLGQYAALQEAGLAQTEVPQEEEAPLVVVESAPRGRAARPRRETVDRYLESDELDANGFDRDRRKLQRREHRGEELGRE